MSLTPLPPQTKKITKNKMETTAKCNCMLVGLPFPIYCNTNSQYAHYYYGTVSQKNVKLCARKTQVNSTRTKLASRCHRHSADMPCLKMVISWLKLHVRRPSHSVTGTSVSCRQPSFAGRSHWGGLAFGLYTCIQNIRISNSKQFFPNI